MKRRDPAQASGRAPAGLFVAAAFVLAACPSRGPGGDADRGAVEALLRARDGVAAAAVVDLELTARLNMARMLAASPDPSAAAEMLETGEQELAARPDGGRESFVASFRPLGGCTVEPAQAGDAARIVPSVLFHGPSERERAFFAALGPVRRDLRAFRLRCAEGGPWVVAALSGRVVALEDLAPAGPEAAGRLAAFLIPGAGVAEPAPSPPVDVVIEGPPGAAIEVAGATHPLPHRLTGLAVGSELAVVLSRPSASAEALVLTVPDPAAFAPFGPRPTSQTWWVLPSP